MAHLEDFLLTSKCPTLLLNSSRKKLRHLRLLLKEFKPLRVDLLVTI